MKIPRWTLVVIPPAMFALGFLMNAVVMAVNGGQMPVLIPGGNCGLIDDSDIIHSCMTAHTHLKILADWIVINHVGVASPGDFFEWASEVVSAPTLVAWCALTLHKIGIIGD